MMMENILSLLKIYIKLNLVIMKIVIKKLKMKFLIQIIKKYHHILKLIKKLVLNQKVHQINYQKLIILN